MNKAPRLPWHPIAEAAFDRGLNKQACWREVQGTYPNVTLPAVRCYLLRHQRRQHIAPRANDAIVSPLSERVITLAELMALFEIDPEQWEAVECTPNMWQMGARHPTTGAILTAPLYQLKARLKRKAGPSLIALRDGLLADMRAEAAAHATGHAVVRLALGEPDTRHMLEVSAFDVHFGKLSWHEETGFDYDLSIARARFQAAIEDLIGKASGFPLQRILLPIGNDLLQTDNIQGTTTGGTPQDTDSRYHKAFRHARSAVAWAIDRLAQLAPVLVIVVPGNHDRLAAFHMGEVLEAQFAADPRITVDNSPKLRKYVPFGVNLLGFTHGSEEKHADLPLIMAREEPEAWARAKHYEWHIGHLHKSKETRYTAGDSFNGVRVRVLPSLCEADAWHYSKGYIGERQSAEGYLWNFATGYAGHVAANVLRPGREAA